MNTRFPLLSLVSIILRVVGGLVTLVGVYYFLYEGIIEPNQVGHIFSPQDAMELVGGLIGTVIGLLSVAFGEVIGVLFAIEENTRRKA